MKIFDLLTATIVLSLLELFSELALGNQLKPYGGNLVALCKGKKTDFRNVGDLYNLVRLLDKEDERKECSDEVANALRTLGEIVRDTRACSLEKTQALVEFYETFLWDSPEDLNEADQSDDANTNTNTRTQNMGMGFGVNKDKNQPKKEDKAKTKAKESKRKSLPKPLIRFALAYGMKTHTICKKYLFQKFLPDADKLLTREDFEELAEFTNKTGPIDRLLSPFKSDDEVLLHKDLMSVLPSNGRVANKMLMITTNGGRLNRLKEVCSKRFKPLYKNVLLPLSLLLSSGVDYEQALVYIDIKMRSRKTIEKAALWTRIVYLCESLEMFDSYERVGQVQAQKAPVNTNTETVKFELISANNDENEDDDEARQRAKLGANNVVRLPEPCLDRDQLEPYVPMVKIDDQILNLMDLRIKARIKTFNERKSDVQRLHDKIVKRAQRIVKSRFIYGEYKQLFRAGIMAIKNSLKRDPNARKQFADEELNDLLDDKDESKLYMLLHGIWKSMNRLLPFIAMMVMRLVLACAIGALVLANKNDRIDMLNRFLEQY